MNKQQKSPRKIVDVKKNKKKKFQCAEAQANNQLL